MQLRTNLESWLSRYISPLTGSADGSTDAGDLRASLDTAAKGILLGAAAFLFMLAPVGASLDIRTGLLFDAHPFGTALLSAASAHVPFIAAGCALASLFMGSMAVPTFLGVCFTLLVRLGVGMLLRNNTGSKSAPVGLFSEPIVLRIGCAVASAALIAGYRMIAGGFLYYDIIGGIVELCTIPLFCFIFIGALERDKRYTPAYEFGVMGFMFAAVSSLRPYMPFGFSLAGVASALITLFISKTGGLLRGGIAGLVTGLAAYPTFSPAFALMGLASGMLWGIGSAAASSAAAVIGIGCGIVLEGFSALTLIAPEAVAASVIFTPLAHFELLPKLRPFADNLPDTAQLRGAETALRARDGAVERLETLSTSMAELSDVFYRLSDRLRQPQPYDMRTLCEDVFDSACASCHKYPTCRERERSSYDDAIAGLVTRLVKGERVSTGDMPKYFTDRCRSAAAIADEINKKQGELTEELFTRDSTRVFAMDYEAISKLLDYAAKENRAAFEPDERLCGELTECARCIGLYASNITAYGKRRKTVVAGGIDMSRPCAGGEDIRQAFSKVVGCRFGMPQYLVDGDYVSMELCSQRNFRVDYARASRASEGGGASDLSGGDRVNGDIITSFDNSEDYRYILISDGMGSGREAALTSRSAGIFLEKLLRCGNSKAVALEMLNNFIRSKNMESFATIDLLEVDLIGGEACFVKSGAAPSYVLRGEDLFKIASNTMPIGITRELNAEEIRFSLKAGDIVVMVSDGVAQSFEDGVWLATMLAREWDDERSLRDSAEMILARALEKVGARRDDMTVGVVRICDAQ